MFLIGSVILLIGLVCGSFFTVIGTRLPKGESIVLPSSHCESCQHQLTAYELLPVISFLALRGKCRRCGKKIHWLHPLIESVTGILFLMSYLTFGFSAELLVAWLFIALLAIVTVSDQLYLIIPDKVLVTLGLPLVIMRIVSPLEPWWDAIVGSIFGFGLFTFIASVTKGGIGGGDIKLYFVIGLVLGLKLTFISIFVAAFIGLVVSLFLRIKKGIPIPFGPSIAVGSMISYFYGDYLFALYMSWIM